MEFLSLIGDTSTDVDRLWLEDVDIENLVVSELDVMDMEQSKVVTALDAAETFA